MTISIDHDHYHDHYHSIRSNDHAPQLAFTCSKSTMKTTEQRVKSVASQ